MKTKVKICGLKREEDINIVNKYKPEFIGFVFAESPRKISYSEAKNLKSKLSKDIIPVGVFVNEDLENIVDLFADDIIAIAQLHGNEDGDYVKKLKNQSFKRTGRELAIIKVLELNNFGNFNQEASLNQTDSFIDDSFIDTYKEQYSSEYLDFISAFKEEFSSADYFLLDSSKGSGKTFNWDLISEEDKSNLEKPFFLAGGLNKSNLIEAIDEFKPFSLDLSSGLETDGFKDESKVKDVLNIVRNYDY